MSTQIVITASQMALAGFTRQQEVVSQGYRCPDCGGENPDCDYCAGNGHGFDTVRTVFVRGDEILASYSHKDFVADCSHWGGNRKILGSMGLLDLEHRFV